MIEELGVAVAFLGLASMICGLLGIFFTITVAFSRIREVETRIATPDTYLDMTRTLWGSAPWGQWIRAMMYGPFPYAVIFVISAVYLTIVE